MRLGSRPDRHDNRVLRTLGVLRRWVDNRIVHLLVLVFVLLVVGMLTALVLAVPDDPAVSNPARRIVEGGLTALGMDPRDTFLIISGVRHENIRVPGNIVRGYLSNPEHLELQIAAADVQRLAHDREVALEQGYWVPTDEDYVPVTITRNGEVLHGSVRLKGDWVDHWYSEKWSLRFKLDHGDRLDYMGEFGLHAPRVRNDMHEWVFQQALAREGVSGISYRFVDVTINGRRMGTYALEQEFDEGVPWYNREPPGPLVRFSKGDLHQAIVEDRRMPDPERTVALDVLGQNETAQGYTENETATALRLLEEWRRGELPTSDAFDLGRTARFFALSDLCGNVHGDLIHNIRFYFNPVTARLEPVGVDANAGYYIDGIKGLSDSPYYRMFFDDPVFFEQYLAELDRIRADGYLEALFEETRSGFQENLTTIYRDQPYYFFEDDTYFANREVIRRALAPYRAVSAYANGTSEGRLRVDLGASQPLPVEVTALYVGDLRSLPDGGAFRLPGKILNEPVEFRQVAFSLPGSAGWNATTPLQLECRVVGTGDVRREPVIATPRIAPGAGAVSLARLPASADRFAFAVTDDERREVYLEPGSHRLAEPLVLPEGYGLVCGPGTTLDLVRNASIVARGPLAWEGSEQDPIVVRSSDGTGGGLVVMRAKNTSTLARVHLAGLAGVDSETGNGTVLTFLESPVVLDHISVVGAGTTPLLRLVDSQFSLARSAFERGADPAVSVEFSRGTINGTRVAEGSGVRITGSEVGIGQARFEQITGTAVNAERESTISGEEIECTGAGTALEVRAGSSVDISFLALRDVEVGVSAGAAESGSEPGKVVLRQVSLANVTTPYGMGEDSSIVVDGRRVGT